MGTLWQDLRYGFRMLARNPGFTAVVVLVLGLGIAANTAIFNAVDQVLLRPLPVDKPHELVLLECRWVDEDDGESIVDQTFNYPLYESYRDQSGVFASLVAFHDRAVKLTVDDMEYQLQGMAVSNDYFAILGIRPSLGSLVFPADDAASAAEPRVVISDGLWRRRFGGDPRAIGTHVTIDGHPVIVTGVLPRGFTGTVIGCAPDIYISLGTQSAIWHQPLNDRSSANWYLLGRLKRGVSREQAQAALRVLAAQIRQVEPNNTHAEIFVMDGSRGPVNWQRQQGRMPLLLLMAVASIVLLIACANVANMQLARAVTREKEIAMRQALGASRGRILRQLLVESLVLALVGGACGVLMAMWLDRLICVVMATISSVRVVPGLDARILLFGLAVSCVSGVLFGLAPALRTMLGVTPALGLRANHGSPLRAAHWNAHGLLVVVQMACSMMVLVCGGLCLFSLIKVRWMDPGFDPARILAVSVDSRQTLGSPLQFFEDLQRRVTQLPHVESVSLAGQIPLAGEGGYTTGVRRIEGRDLSAGEEIIVDHAFVNPGYFRTLGLPLLKGRDIGSTDAEGSAHVMVINEIMAQRCWPGQDPIGKHVTFPTPEPQAEKTLEVVGVVKASKHGHIGEELKPVVYRPLLRVPEGRPAMLVRVARNSKVVADNVRKTMMSLGVPVSACDARAIVQRQSGLFRPQRILTGIVGTFGLVVLVLSATGIYGVTACAVRRRTREIGIRIAMGAQRHDILTLVLFKVAALTAAGLTLGIGMSLIAMRLLESNLPGLHAWNPEFLLGATSSDPLPYVCAAVVLILAAFVACFLPAHRAARTDPMNALRHE